MNEEELIETMQAVEKNQCGIIRLIGDLDRLGANVEELQRANMFLGAYWESLKEQIKETE